jgi:hypothetical protein
LRPVIFQRATNSSMEFNSSALESRETLTAFKRIASSNN